MTASSGAKLVVQALEDEGIRFAFGIPGTHNIALYDALAESRSVRTVLVTDEQSAGFMADGVWRANRELACVNLVPGAGLTHALSGIAEAYLDGMALLVLGCGIPDDPARGYRLHGIDQLALAAPVCKTTFRCPSVGDVYRTIREACAIARAGTPGPVMVEVSSDQYSLRADSAPLTTPASAPTSAVDPTRLAGAVALLGAPGARPLLYAGWGAASAGTDLVRLAERLGAPVATTITGKGVFPEDHPLFLWNGFGPAAPPFARKVADGRNVTLAIGCRFSEVGTAGYTCIPRGDLIHADIDPAVPGRNYPAAVALTGDASAVVAGLLARLGGPDRRDPELERTIATGRAETAADQLGRSDTGRVNPARLFAAIERTFGPDTIYATDSGNGTFLAMECLTLRRAGQLLAPVDFSSMGYAIPAAIGARLARPDRPVVALPGDGALLMTGLELLTAANQRAPIAVIVLRDRELAQIAQFQQLSFGRRVATTLPDFDVGSLAEAVGVEWIRLERDGDIEEAIGHALRTTRQGRPIVVDVAIDYDQPTWFTRGVVRTNLGRLPFGERLRAIVRAAGRRLRS